MKKTFSHLVDDSGQGHIPFNTDAAPPARVRMKIDSDGNFWLSANRDGFLHLARVFAELGLRDFQAEYHFHKDESFKHPKGGVPEFTFGLIHDKPT